MPEEKKKDEEEEPRIDPSSLPSNSKNLETARQLGWRFDSASGYYRDSDGEIVADRFGQSLG